MTAKGLLVLILLTLTALASGPVPPTARTDARLVLNVGYDSDVDPGNPTQNFGTSFRMRCGQIDASRSYYSFLYFDLSSIPNGATIQSCSLGLYCYYRTNTSAQDWYQVNRVVGAWTETGINWNNQPAVTAVDCDSTWVTTTTWYYWNVTPIVQAWLTGTPNYGLRVHKPSTAYDIRHYWYAREHTVDSLKPVLIVNYTVSGGVNITVLGRTPQYPFSYENVVVTAKLYGTSTPVDSARIGYRNQSGSFVYLPADSSRSSDSTYYFHIPPMTGGDTVYWQIQGFAGGVPTNSAVQSYVLPLDRTIEQVQFVDTLVGQTSPDSGRYVRVNAIVTGIMNQGRVFIGTRTGGAWNGMFVYRAGTPEPFALGESLELAGYITEFNRLSQFNDLVRFVRRGNDRQFDTTRIAFAQSKQEAFEGVLVRLDTVRMVEQGGNFTGNTNYRLTNRDGSDTVRLYVYNQSQVVGMAIPAGYHSLVANISDYNGRQVCPRYPADFIFLTPDVAVTAVLLPADTVTNGETITPRAVITNVSTLNTAATVPVTFRIGSSYSNQRTVSDLAPGASDTLVFPDWTAAGGTFGVEVFSELAGDPNPANDTLRRTLVVLVRDVGVTAITRPGPLVQTGVPLTPRVRLRSFGNSAATFDVRLVIERSGTVVFDTAETGITLPGNTAEYHDFASSWTPVELGTHEVRSWTVLAGDPVPTNDTAYSVVEVQSGPVAAWTPVGLMPTTPSGRQSKDGAWMVEVDGQFYVSKGGKTEDFYRYNPAVDSWYTITGMPRGAENKPPSKGACAVAGDNGLIYAIKGNNTSSFYSYDPASDQWTQLADVPLGSSNKRVKGGTDIVFYRPQGRPDSSWLYLLKGDKTEFYRFSIQSGTWESLPSAPAGIKPKWDRGSWLVLERNPGHDRYKLYAHKAKNHEFYRFDLLTGVWDSVLKPMPLASRLTTRMRKTKEGCATYFDGFIYAFKAANTQEFWRYDIAGDSWTELDTIPAVGPSNRKKRVKAGCDLLPWNGLIYALKGNKSNELWTFNPAVVSVANLPVGGARDGVANAGRTSSIGLVVPAVVRGNTIVLRCSPSRSGDIGVRLCAADGRTVLFQRAAVQSGGRIEVPLVQLPAGVYLLVLNTGSGEVARRLTLVR